MYVCMYVYRYATETMHAVGTHRGGATCLFISHLIRLHAHILVHSMLIIVWRTSNT